jgi:hypothetical protein
VEGKRGGRRKQNLSPLPRTKLPLMEKPHWEVEKTQRKNILSRERRELFRAATHVLVDVEVRVFGCAHNKYSRPFS